MRVRAGLTLGLGMVLTVVSIGWGTVTVASLLWLRTEEGVLTSSLAPERVVVTNPCGDITLTSGDADTVRVRVRGLWTFDEPQTVLTEQDDVLEVSASCPLSAGIGATVDFSVELPTGVSVQAESQAGSVVGEGLTSTIVDASSDAGDVTLAFSVAPADVSASSSAGDVLVYLPDDGTAYRVDARSTDDDERVAVRTDPEGARSVAATSSAGSVEVAYALD